MSALVKKEIHLLRPAWIVAMALAAAQAAMDSYDFYAAALLFFGLTILALSPIGRESSLNTFSWMLSQPAERLRIWNAKLSLLAAAYLSVLAVWLAAFGIACLNSNINSFGNANTPLFSYDLFIAVCLIAMATFTGGLWTALLLRQPAAAFWLTLLAPATLSGCAVVSVASADSESLIIAVLSLVIGFYSLAGFFLARWLFFRAQDVGWSGGTIVMPEWTFLSSRAGIREEVRNRKPIRALVKKEVQLQQGVLTGAAGLAVLHAAVILLRKFHQFPRNSAGEVLVSVFWVLWLVLPALLGSIALAEERKLGVMEGQLCLPASRRTQYGLKVFMTLCLGLFLGGVMPALMETLGWAIGSRNPALVSVNRPDREGLYTLLAGCLGSSAWLVVASLFASSMAKNFLQAIGLALVTYVCTLMWAPTLMNPHIVFLDNNRWQTILPMLIAIPLFLMVLLGLGYVNFKSFREGWPLYRRNLLGVAGTLVFVVVSANALYYRVWEVFEPAEPAHGAARLTLADPPSLGINPGGNVLVRLPDGRVWFDYLEAFPDHRNWWFLARSAFAPLVKSGGPEMFLAGSNWVAASAGHFYDRATDFTGGTNREIIFEGYTDSVGIQPDGTLWVSGKSDQKNWTANRLERFGADADWKQLVAPNSFESILLLKTNGTLWSWGPRGFYLPTAWPGLRAFQPTRLGTNSDWTDIVGRSSFLARKADGSVWEVRLHYAKDGEADFRVTTNNGVIPFRTDSGWAETGAYARANGTLWVFVQTDGYGRQAPRTWQNGDGTNWVQAAGNWQGMMALKSDGTLWQWDNFYHRVNPGQRTPGTRLGIHNDWVALARYYDGFITLAADGSLWYWPTRDIYQYQLFLLRLPKQPLFIANVFDPAK